MPKPLAHSTPKGRYSYERVVDEISQRISMLPRGESARLARELGLTTSQFSHRMRGVKSRFTTEQIGVIADRIVPGGAPVCWPYLPWSACEVLAGRSPGPARLGGGASRSRARLGLPRAKRRA